MARNILCTRMVNREKASQIRGAALIAGGLPSISTLSPIVAVARDGLRLVLSKVHGEKAYVHHLNFKDVL